MEASARPKCVEVREVDYPGRCHRSDKPFREELQRRADSMSLQDLKYQLASTGAAAAGVRKDAARTLRRSRCRPMSRRKSFDMEDRWYGTCGISNASPMVGSTCITRIALIARTWFQILSDTAKFRQRDTMVLCMSSVERIDTTYKSLNSLDLIASCPCHHSIVLLTVNRRSMLV